MTAERDRTRALLAASLCLDYPDQTLLDDAPLIAEVAGALPPAAGVPLSPCRGSLGTTSTPSTCVGAVAST